MLDPPFVSPVSSFSLPSARVRSSSAPDGTVTALTPFVFSFTPSDMFTPANVRLAVTPLSMTMRSVVDFELSVFLIVRGVPVFIVSTPPA